MEQQELHLTVNGEDHTLACDPDLPLLDVLRARPSPARRTSSRGKSGSQASACSSPFTVTCNSCCVIASPVPGPG